MQIPQELEVTRQGVWKFPTLHNYYDPQYLQIQATMSSTNDIIQQKSFEMVERSSGEMVISNSIASCVEDEDVATYDAEVLSKINPSGIPPT